MGSNEKRETDGGLEQSQPSDQEAQTGRQSEGAETDARWFFVTIKTFNLLQQMVICATIVLCVWPIAGNLARFGQFINAVQWDRYLLLALLLFGGAGTQQKLRSLQRGVDREHRRVKELEEAIDPNRDSSGIDDKGNTGFE
ncbi:MAG: hypothetical protein HQ581_29315 [Planctomycetes bacterium]|nr:hypothetical protein [Planctomycetota bacterium]